MSCVSENLKRTITFETCCKPASEGSNPSGVEADKLQNHIARKYGNLLYPNQPQKGRNQLRNCVPTPPDPCDGPSC